MMKSYRVIINGYVYHARAGGSRFSWTLALRSSLIQYEKKLTNTHSLICGSCGYKARTLKGITRHQNKEQHNDTLPANISITEDKELEKTHQIDVMFAERIKEGRQAVILNKEEEEMRD